MLNEQPERERAQVGSTVRAGWIAFGVGLLLAVFTANSLLSNLGSGPTDISFPPWTVWMPFQIPLPFFLLLPLLLGIVVPLTVGSQNKSLVASSTARSLLVWAGASLYWFPLAAFEDDKWTQEARTQCQLVNNHGWCGVHLGATGLLYYLLFAALLMLLFALITALLRKIARKLLPA